MNKLYNQNEKIALAHYAQYLRSATYSLDEIYDRYSAAKRSAWEYCIGLMRDLKGSGLKVISHNCMMFSAGFEYPDPKTGVLKFLYITRDYNREVEIPADLL